MYIQCSNKKDIVFIRWLKTAKIQRTYLVLFGLEKKLLKLSCMIGLSLNNNVLIEAKMCEQCDACNRD